MPLARFPDRMLPLFWGVWENFSSDQKMKVGQRLIFTPVSLPTIQGWCLLLIEDGFGIHLEDSGFFHEGIRRSD